MNDGEILIQLETLMARVRQLEQEVWELKGR